MKPSEQFRWFPGCYESSGNPCAGFVPPRWLRCSILATVWCTKPQAHRKSFTWGENVALVPEGNSRPRLRPLSHQTFMFPDGSTLMSVSHTHTHRTALALVSRQVTINKPEPLLVIANNYSSHRYTELFDPAIILINGVMELRRLQREHGRQTGWKLCSPLGSTTSEMPLTTGQYHEGLQRTEGSPFTDFLHLWVFAALSHLQASQTMRQRNKKH